jgi:hypothetical protein
MRVTVIDLDSPNGGTEPMDELVPDEHMEAVLARDEGSSYPEPFPGFRPLALSTVMALAIFSEHLVVVVHLPCSCIRLSVRLF